jgi:hypothetical protein
MAQTDEGRLTRLMEQLVALRSGSGTGDRHQR